MPFQGPVTHAAVSRTIAAVKQVLRETAGRDQVLQPEELAAYAQKVGQYDPAGIYKPEFVAVVQTMAKDHGAHRFGVPVVHLLRDADSFEASIIEKSKKSSRDVVVSAAEENRLTYDELQIVKLARSNMYGYPVF